MKLKLTLLFVLFVFTYNGSAYTVYYSTDVDAYRGRAMANGEICNEANCPAPNVCGSSGEAVACICDESFANYPFTGQNNKYCQYKRKRQLVAFLWEICTNLGVGHYYIHKNMTGAFKTCVMLIPIILLVCGKLHLIKYKFSDGTTGIFVCTVIILFFIAAFCWWLVDAIRFGMNKNRDHNYVPLKHW